MDRMDRRTALTAISWCDQMEAAIKRGDQRNVEAAKEYIMQWASDLDAGDIVTWIACLRARCEEIIREGAEAIE